MDQRLFCQFMAGVIGLEYTSAGQEILDQPLIAEQDTFPQLAGPLVIGHATRPPMRRTKEGSKKQTAKKPGKRHLNAPSKSLFRIVLSGSCNSPKIQNVHCSLSCICTKRKRSQTGKPGLPRNATGNRPAPGRNRCHLRVDEKGSARHSRTPFQFVTGPGIVCGPPQGNAHELAD